MKQKKKTQNLIHTQKPLKLKIKKTTSDNLKALF